MSPGEATTMAGLLGGPAVVGVVALVGYVRGVLGHTDRDPKAGWLSFLICAVLVRVVRRLPSVEHLRRAALVGGGWRR